MFDVWILQRHDGAKIVQGVCHYMDLDNVQRRRLNRGLRGGGSARIYIDDHGDLIAQIINPDQQPFSLVLRYAEKEERFHHE